MFIKQHCKKIFFLWVITFFWLVRLSAQPPDTLWTKTYGEEGDDYGYSVQQTADGGYIIAGRTSSFGTGSIDVYLIKTDSLGNLVFQKTYGGPNSDFGYSVKQTTDGGYIIAGRTLINNIVHNDVYLIKTDSLGDTLWTKTYGGSHNEWAYSVQQTADEGYILAGQTSSFGGLPWSVYLIKTDSLGNTLWTKTYGIGNDGYLNAFNHGYSVQQTTDGGYAIAGWTSVSPSVPPAEDVFLIKTDSLGDTLWTKTYERVNSGGGVISHEFGYSMQQTGDEGYIIAGFVSIPSAHSNVFLVRTDSLGDTLWQRTYGGVNDEVGQSVQQTADGGFITTGYSYDYDTGDWEVYLIKTNSQGDSLWTKTLCGINGDEEGCSVQQTTDEGYIIAGRTTSFSAGYNDVYLIKIGPEIGIEENQKLKVKMQNVKLEISPNPFTGKTKIRWQMADIQSQKPKAENGKILLKIFDTTGRLIKQFNHLSANNCGGIQPFNQIVWDGTDNAGNCLPQGIYFLRLNTSNYAITKKVCKLK
jgi:hypothetical protein